MPSTAADKGGADAMIEDKGGFGAVEFDADAELIHGVGINTRDIVTFQVSSVAEVQLAFHESGNDDREFCRRRSESPAKTRPGPFVFRISPALHRPAHIAPTMAVKRHNVWVTEKLQGALQRNTAVTGPPPRTGVTLPSPPGGSPGAMHDRRLIGRGARVILPIGLNAGAGTIFMERLVNRHQRMRFLVTSRKSPVEILVQFRGMPRVK